MPIYDPSKTPKSFKHTGSQSKIKNLKILKFDMFDDLPKAPKSVHCHSCYPNSKDCMSKHNGYIYLRTPIYIYIYVRIFCSQRPSWPKHRRKIIEQS